MSKKHIYAMFTIAVLTVFTSEQAHAAVDLRPAVTVALEWAAMALVTVLTVLGGMGIRYIGVKTGLTNSELEASFNQRLDDIIRMGVQHAHVIALNKVNQSDTLSEVKFDNFFLDIVIGYVANRAPEIVNKFKLTKADITDIILPRVRDYMGDIFPESALDIPPDPNSPSREVIKLT